MYTIDTARLNAFVVLVGFMVAVLFQLINLRFQREAESVFQTFPKTVKVTFAILIIFGFACGIGTWVVHEDLSPSWAERITTGIVFFACLFVGSLACLVFPAALPLLGRSCQRLAHRIIDKLYPLFPRIRQSFLKKKPPLLPLTKSDAAPPVVSKGTTPEN